MDLNLIFSLLAILSGIYSLFCFVPATGKRLLPHLYSEGVSATQRYSVLFGGLFSMVVGMYSIFIKPLFI